MYNVTGSGPKRCMIASSGRWRASLIDLHLSRVTDAESWTASGIRISSHRIPFSELELVPLRTLAMNEHLSLDTLPLEALHDVRALRLPELAVGVDRLAVACLDFENVLVWEFSHGSNVGD